VAGVCVGALESIDVGGFTEDLRRRERPAATDRKEGRSELLDQGGDLGLEPVDLGGKCAAAIDELARYPCEGSFERCETFSEAVEVARWLSVLRAGSLPGSS
jgi:hypothetical protein